MFNRFPYFLGSNSDLEIPYCHVPNCQTQKEYVTHEINSSLVALSFSDFLTKLGRKCTNTDGVMKYNSEFGCSRFQSVFCEMNIQNIMLMPTIL